jgi:hypothetical protein
MTKKKKKTSKKKTKKSKTKKSPVKQTKKKATRKKLAPKKKKVNKRPKVLESEFLEVLDKITKKLIHKFRFGYHSTEDMKQQASIFALEALDRYDGKRPLENFLWTHVRNRLFNFKRNNYQRPDSPCIGCKFHDKNLENSKSGCLEFTNKIDCHLYNNWFKRNENKKNIMQPSYIENDQEYFSSKFGSDVAGDKEIVEFLDANIESEFRESYLKLKHGTKVNKDKFDKLKAHILTLLNDYNQR